MPSYDVIVVGAGPAGMMAAGRAAERGRRVLLLERGPMPGRKLLITATGRCNVTNTAPLPEFLQAFGRHGGFLRDALTAFSNADMITWLHQRGVETVEERKGRVFPASQDARTILKALTDYMAAGKVEVRTGCRARALRIESGSLRGVSTESGEIEAWHVLIATGGLSYPETGCTGDGYQLARLVGHTIIPTWPAIVAMETQEAWPARIQGTPIKNVSIRGVQEKRALAEIFGEALWTHYGISGPAILDISREIVPALKDGPVVLRLDLRPADDAAAIDDRLLNAIKRDGKKQIATVLSEMIPAKTAAVLLDVEGIDAKKKMNQVSKSDRRRIIGLLKTLELHVTRPRPISEAIVTGGGVSLAEVDPKRMESRLLPGLFFAGEVLDLAGPSGGYNLQAAFSTGWLASNSD